MNACNDKILTIEEYPAFQNLVNSIIKDVSKLEVESRSSPEAGRKLVHKSPPYPIVWSGHRFKKSNQCGLEFLKFCKQKSPVSARILCSEFLDRDELLQLVKCGDIDSYYDKTDFPAVLACVSSAIAIGLEKYKVNIHDYIKNIKRLSNTDELNTLLAYLKISLQTSLSESSYWEVEGRDLEKKMLIDRIESSLDRPNTSTPINLENFNQEEIEKDYQSCSELCQMANEQIINLDAHLNRSRQVLLKSLKNSRVVSRHTAEREIFVKKIKTEFFNRINLQDLFEGSIPTLPQVFYRFKEAAENPYSAFEESADVIASEPGLASRLLKIVNSPVYCFSNPVETIPQAISIIGGTQLSDLALSTCVMDQFDQVYLKGLDIELFWQHGIACGLSAKILAKHLNLANPESIFVGGLLHDIGRLLIALKAPDEYSHIYLLSENKGQSLEDSEKTLLGFDQTQVGQELLRIWEFPEIHQETVRYHHCPMEAPKFKREAAVVAIANTVSNSLGLGSSGEFHDVNFDPDALEILKIDDESFFGEIEEEVQDQYQTTIDAFL